MNWNKNESYVDNMTCLFKMLYTYDFGCGAKWFLQIEKKSKTESKKEREGKKERKKERKKIVKIRICHLSKSK